MDAEIYQESRKKLLALLDKLRGLRDNIVGHNALFIESLPADVRLRIANLDREAYRLRKPDLTIAFVGGFSAGKSSLVNAFLGRYLLPESTKVTTAVPTFVRATDGNEEAELHYLNEADFLSLGDMYRKELSEKFDLPDLTTMPFETLVETVEPRAKEGAGRQMLEQFKRYNKKRRERELGARGEVRTVDLADAQDKIRDDNEAMFLDRVVIKIATDDIPKDVVLVDLPGVSVPNPRHRKITFQFVEHDAHAVIFVLLATRLFDKDEMEVMEKFQGNGNPISDKAFWVLNRWDALSMQQQGQTINDFEAKMEEFGIQPGARTFYTNALHGLLAQLGRRREEPADLALQSHLHDYDVALPMRYDNSHETAFRDSQIPRLQEQVLRFINGQLRQTTLRSAVESTKLNFSEPVAYHLRRAKDNDDALIREKLAVKQKEDAGQRIDSRFTMRVNHIKEVLKELRNDVAKKRSTILKERTNQLVEQLQEMIEKGPETDAFQVYQNIIAGRELRKYPYHFEIEMEIVDSLNAMLKKNFRRIVREQVETVFKDLTSKIHDALEQVREDVEYSEQVMAPFDELIRNEEKSFGDRVDGNVMTLAAQLDELLLYKPKAYFGFSGGNEILEGLEQAARMGLENLKGAGQQIEKEHFTAKTDKIRETLTVHYIEKVRQCHVHLTDNVFPLVINNMQEIEKRILETMQSKYRPALETVIANEIEGEFADRRRSLEQRSRRFRDYIEQIGQLDKEMEIVLNSALETQGASDN